MLPPPCFMCSVMRFVWAWLPSSHSTHKGISEGVLAGKVILPSLLGSLWIPVKLWDTDCSSELFHTSPDRSACENRNVSLCWSNIGHQYLTYELPSLMSDHTDVWPHLPDHSHSWLVTQCVGKTVILVGVLEALNSLFLTLYSWDDHLKWKRRNL